MASGTNVQEREWYYDYYLGADLGPLNPWKSEFTDEEWMAVVKKIENDEDLTEAEAEGYWKVMDEVY